MMKLMIKDFKAFGQYVLFQMIFIILLISVGIFFDPRGNLVFIALLMYPLVIPLLFLFSDKGFETLFNSMPCTRTSWVISKYASGIIGSAFLILFGMLYGHIMTSYIVPNSVRFDALFSISGLVILLIPILLFNSLAFPVYVRFSKQRGSYVIIFIFALMLIALLVGVVLFEKKIAADMTFAREEIMPAIMFYISNFVGKIGKNNFLLLLAGCTGGILTLSVLLSLWGFKTKDIGGE